MLTRTLAILALSAALSPVALADPGAHGGPKACPPGLAKKGCIPPGQAKKYDIGGHLPREYDRFRDYDRYDLKAPPPGYYYSRVDDDVLLVDEDTRTIISLVSILGALAQQ
ncbi:RcnB family protein [Hyphomonas chukchiensis]|uniref:Excinuclease ABC subunit A n=1 Tax=Hyphomonas chukchiensis TaxID=1280947 RepID=A0A062UPV7_9PROT|nr:RcnB family protein [Hyphomonas chukchiensis]KCZ59581.1 hypothetical protein HY30_14190 [Hyphomonas chukchiensis]|tara:strand:- start:2040 stop:2372 length:333 start_codon:yes stop_codon:yes gene_type:complete